MSQLHLIGALVRLFAIYLVVTTLKLAPTFVSSAITWRADGAAIASATAALLAPLVAAALLWIYSLGVARLLYLGPSQDLSLPDARLLEETLFAIVGLWLFCSGVIDAAFWLSFYLLSGTAQDLDPVVTPKQIGSLVAVVASLLIGFVLVVRARGLVRVVYMLRGRGAEPGSSA